MSDQRMGALPAIVETRPDPATDGVFRWRRIDLKRVIEEHLGVTYSERAISGLLAALSFSRISGRPQHPEQGGRVIEAFKNLRRTLAAHIADLPKTKRIGIWFQDEARLTQKNGRGRSRAQTGTRPRPSADRRYTNAYLFGAICPRWGKGAALMRPFANTAAMQIHLDEFSRNIAARAHGVVPMDRAGCHCSDKLAVPRNLTIILLLPSRLPEANPVENIWHYLRQNWLSIRVSADCDAIIEAGCQAWNKLIDQPETNISIGLRD